MILRGLGPKTIIGQITALVIVCMALGLGLSTVILLASFEAATAGEHRHQEGRIATIATLARAARSAAETDTVIATAQRSGAPVWRVPLTSLRPRKQAQLDLLLREIKLSLSRKHRRLELRPLSVQSPTGEPLLAVPITASDALVVADVSPRNIYQLLTHRLVPTLLLLLIFVVAIAAYAAYYIVSPLSQFASAAQQFGRSQDAGVRLKEAGPVEVVKLASALNEMRTRIKALLDERTQILVAISHDLRTPLTRLRLRAERIADAPIGRPLLTDIEKISSMLNETLHYLQGGAAVDAMARIDLPSLLQTICAEFSDIGHKVTYVGPSQLVYSVCENSFTRAVTNIVENAVKHGSAASVNLALSSASAVVISIHDDGPGVPEALRARVFEPFFKTNAARTAISNEGFGLGLSIARDVIKMHGGSISLASNTPSGLVVHITLPPVAAAD